MLGDDLDEKPSHRRIFHSIGNDSSLPPEERNVQRLIDEASSLIAAGTLTTSHTLSITIFHVLNNPDILKRLMDELNAHIPNPESSLSLQLLESLPYLNALINEGLRLSHGVTQRLSRSHPDDELQYREWRIPPNTAVGMTPYFLHIDESIFPNPHSFIPDRWLDTDHGDSLRRYLFSFGKGSRQCLGIPLAYAEMYLTLAYFFRYEGYTIQLHDTDYHRDLEFAQDYFVPLPSVNSRGLRVTRAATQNGEKKGD